MCMGDSIEVIQNGVEGKNLAVQAEAGNQQRACMQGGLGHAPWGGQRITEHAQT